jgi:hypothetical protein
MKQGEFGRLCGAMGAFPLVDPPSVLSVVVVLMRGGSVAFSVAGPAMSTFCWAAHCTLHTSSPWGSPLTAICDSKFPLLVHARAGGGLPKQQPKTKPMGMLCICCTR